MIPKLTSTLSGLLGSCFWSTRGARRGGWIVLLTSLLLGASSLPAQPSVPVLSGRALAQQPIPLDRGWLFHPPTPTPPAADSEAWRPLLHTFAEPGQFPSDWSGIGWFRLVVDVPGELAGVPLALRLYQAGASEVYIDDLLVTTYGQPAATADEESIFDPKGTPLAFVVSSPGPHTITLRYSCSAAADPRLARWITAYQGAGFRAVLDQPERAVAENARVRFLYLALNIGGGALALGFAILHGLIYFFHPRHRGNLWFSLFALCLSANGFLDVALQWGQLGLWGQSWVRLVNLLAASGLILFLVFFLTTLERRTTPRFVFWLAAGFLPSLVCFVVPSLHPHFPLIFSIWILISGVSALWASLQALRQRAKGSAVLLMSALGWLVVVLTQILKSQWSVLAEVLGFGLGLLLILAGASIYLARRIAREGRQLESLTQELEDRVRERTAELRRSEQAALAASHAKSAFLATMSHEIRTPMNAIIGFSELLDSPKLPPRERDMVGTLKRSALSLLHLLDEVLDLSRIESGRLELEKRSVDLRSLIVQVVELFTPQAQRDGIELRTEIHDDLPETTQGDPLRLRQVLINLLGNALKFTATEGQVTVSARRSDGGLRFEVRDSGIGIPEDVQGQLFDPFFQVDSTSTRRHGGAGLGLAICQRLVASMAGALGVESTLGEGSTFWFEVPFEDPQDEVEWTTEPSMLGSETPAKAADFSSLKILLAEDNEVNQLVTKSMLDRLGCRVRIVPDGHSALAAAATESFDAVLLDLHMPGMDGYEVAKFLRQTASPSSPLLVAHTASAQAEDRRRCLSSGFDAFLAKPVQLDALTQLLEDILENGTGRF